MTNTRRLGALLASGALVLALAGTVSADPKWATPSDWYASSPGDFSNDAPFWEEWFDLDEGDCRKLTSEEFDAVNNGDGTADLGVGYEVVIVKQANPNAKDVTYDNTIFEDVAADETVFADTNGNGVYDEGDSQGISHIIVCVPVETTTSEETTSEETTSEETTSEETTSEETTSEETTSEETTSEETTSEETTSEETTSEETTSDETTSVETTTDETTFTQSTAGETDVPSQPPTTMVGGGPSGPSESSWLLVALLGAFLAGAVILTPARAKSQR